MSAWEFIAAVILAIVGGGVGAAMMSGLHDRWRFKAERMAQKEDKQEERNDATKSLASVNSQQDERLQALEAQVNALVKGQRAIMLDRIIYLGQSYIVKREITYEERKRLRDMHEVYHNDLGGNGDADIIMQNVDKLDLRQG